MSIGRYKVSLGSTSYNLTFRELEELLTEEYSEVRAALIIETLVDMGTYRRKGLEIKRYMVNENKD